MKFKIFVYALMALLLFASAHALTTEGLVFYLKLENTTGTVALDSASNINGVFSPNMDLNKSGIILNGVNLTGSTSINFSDGNWTDLTQYFTMSMWVNVPACPPSNDMFVAKSDGANPANIMLQVWLDSGCQFGMGVFSGGSGSEQNDVSSVIVKNTWNHVMVTWNKTTQNLTFYLNGAWNYSKATGFTSINNVASQLVIGTNDAGGTNYAVGLVDEVSWWNRTLNSSDASYLYNGGAPTIFQQFPFSVPVQPNATLNNITDVNGLKNFSNGTLIESGNISIVGLCEGTNITFTRLNVSYANGTLIKFSTNSSIEVEHGLLPIDGFYNASLYCLDANGLFASEKKYFVINDTVPPSVFWNTPKADNTTSIPTNSSLPIDFTIADINLFSFDIKCYDPLNVLKLNIYRENLSYSPYQYINFTEIITNAGGGRCDIVVTDRHTSKDISSFDISIEKREEVTSFALNNAIMNISLFDNADIKLESLKDRFVFTPDYKEVPALLSYRLSCSKKLYYFDDGSYDGVRRFGKFFNCGDFWIDFKFSNIPYNGKDFAVTLIGDNSARIDVSTKKIVSVNELKTESLGVKNTFVQTVLFTVSASGTSGTDSSFWYGVVGMLILFIIWIVLFLAALRLDFFKFAAGLYGVLFGIAFAVSPYGNTTLAIVFILANVLVFLQGLAK